MNKLYSLALGTALAIITVTTASAYDNLTPIEAYDAVVSNGAYILDVRTDAEYIWVSHPNVENVVNISYKIVKKDEFIVNPSFISDVDEIFESAKDAHIIIMCRSGKRSTAAADALELAGYTNVSNMLDGFQGGAKDEYGYRTINGWMNSGLPGHTTKIGADDYYGD